MNSNTLVGIPLSGLANDKHQTLEESTYNFLRKAIVSGEYAPGTKLVGSRLASQLHVSRLTVANAMKRLISEGFVVGTPHHESVVASLDEKSLHEISLIRYALEEVVMQEVTRNVSPAIVVRLQELNEQLRVSIEQQDTLTYRRLEREYHLLIYTASELPMVVGLLTDLWDRFEPYRGRRFSSLGLRLETYNDHLAIQKALEARSGEELTRVMRAHVEQGYERFRKALESAFVKSTQPDPPKTRQTSPKRKIVVEQIIPGSLRATLENLPDKRRGQGKMHSQSSILALAFCAMLCGVRSRYGVARWGQKCHPAIRSVLGLPYNQGPSIATIHRVFSSLDYSAFELLISNWLTNNGVDVGQIPQSIELETASDELKGIHGELLPGVYLVNSVVHLLHLAASKNFQPDSTASKNQKIVELPMLLLAGKTTTPTALLAQRELLEQILLQNGKVIGSVRAFKPITI